MSNARELAELGGSYGTGGFVGMKNRIINGAMTIFQRGTAATADGVYSVDRFKFVKTNDATESVSQNADAPAGFSNSLRNTVATGDASIAAGQYSGFEQVIEGYNIADLTWGTASAAPVTLSFWVRSSVTGQYTGNLRNSSSTRICPFNFTINAANTWEYKTVTVPGCPDGTWGIVNGVGITVSIYSALGTSLTGGTDGAWNSTSKYGSGTPVNGIASNGNIFAITGVQLEKGSTATSFDFRPYGTELALCQRYCQMIGAGEANGNYLRYMYGECAGTTYMAGNVNLFAKMRITPSLTTTTASQYCVFSRSTVTPCTVLAIGTDGSSPVVANVAATVASGLTIGSGGACMSNNNQTSYMLFTAEL